MGSIDNNSDASTLAAPSPHGMHDAEDRIRQKRHGAWTEEEIASPVVAILGVGYVGSLLAAECSRAGLRVVGYDVSVSRVKELGRQLAGVNFTTRAKDLALATHFLLCVPTSLDEEDGSVDTSCIREALSLVRTHARPRSTVVIESSVAVGTTRALLGPIMARNGLFGGMSPERIDPGRTDPPPTTIPKLVAGLDDVMPGSTAAVARLYRAAGFADVVRVLTPEVAEMAKLYENCQRVVGIAFANEVADACAGLGIDAAAVLDAAATKPFGYLPYTPGVGIGGGCLPANAAYLLRSAGDEGRRQLPLLASAAAAAAARPRMVAERVLGTLAVSARGRSRLEDDTAGGEEGGGGGGGALPRVLVVGIAYKRGQESTTGSPGLEVARALAASARVDLWWIDSLVPQSRVPDLRRLPEGSWSGAVLGTFAHIVVSFLQPGMDPEVLQRLPAGVVVHRW